MESALAGVAVNHPLHHHHPLFLLPFTPFSNSTLRPAISPRFQGLTLRHKNGKQTKFGLTCTAATSTSKEAQPEEEDVVVKERSVSVILLAGGKGTRFGAKMPKQYLPLLGETVALFSLRTFSGMIEVKEIVVVCDPSYQGIFEDVTNEIHVDLKFATPGKERQDSVYNGLQAIASDAELVCIHDSARPLVLTKDVRKVLKDGWLHGASVLGVPCKDTIKEGGADGLVVKTLDRKTLWEIQTPQVIKPSLLKEGFNFVNRERLEVTDDVSIVEHLGHPVYITEGSYTNMKITTPEDLVVAEALLR